jgi:hypothetical protein
MLLFVVPGFIDVKIGSQYKTGDGYSRLLVYDTLGLAARIIPLLLLMPTFPLVSYRRRDIVLIAVPVYGLILSFKICWRLAYIPYVDWPPRPEQAPYIEPFELSDGGHAYRIRVSLWRHNRPGSGARDKGSIQ